MKPQFAITACSMMIGLLLQAGCATSQKTTETAEKQLSAATVAATQPAEKFLTGKVSETMNAGGYTYIELDNGVKKRWIAVPLLDVKVGQELKLYPGTQMGEFTSQTLKRKFDSIIFSPGVVADESAKKVESSAAPATQLPHGHPETGSSPISAVDQSKVDSIANTMPMSHKAMMGGKSTVAGNFASGKVAETMDSGGYTYISLEKEGKKTWFAVPTTPVAVGEEIQLHPGAEMTNFNSKSLNRTFDNIIFSSGVVGK